MEEQEDKVSGKIKLFTIYLYQKELLKNRNYLTLNIQMTFNQLQPQRLMPSNMNTRRDYLWNAIQPGDSYDLRKSMIANLPGEQGHSLKQNPGLMCAFQAAEIERLHKYLDEYRIRYSELENRELDRHSYEVQIRELTEKLRGKDDLMLEIKKLNEYIKRLNTENEELKRNTQSMNRNLSSDYEQALNQINLLLNENKSLKKGNQSHLMIIDNFKVKIQSIERAKNRQIQELRKQIAAYKETSQSMSQVSSLKLKYQSELNQLEREIKRLSNLISEKNNEIQTLKDKNYYLQQEFSTLKSKNSEIPRIQEKMTFLSQSVERLRIMNQEYSQKADQIFKEKMNLESHLRFCENQRLKLEGDIRILSQKLRQANQLINHHESEKGRLSTQKGQINEYERKINSADNQLNRMNYLVQSQSTELNSLKEQRRQYELKISKTTILERENQDLRFRENELKKINQENENKIALLASQIERLRHQLLILTQDNENLSRKVSNTEIKIQNIYEQRIKQIKKEYQTHITNLSQKENLQNNAKLTNLSNQNQKLNIQLGKLQGQNDKLKIRDRERDIFIDQQERQAIQAIKLLKKNVQRLDHINQNLERQLFDKRQQSYKVGQYEKDIRNQRQSYDNLLRDHQNKQAQIRPLQSRLRELERMLQMKENQLSESKNIISRLSSDHLNSEKQNSQLRVKIEKTLILQKDVRYLNERIAVLTVQNENLRKKLLDIQRLQNENQKLQNIIYDKQSQIKRMTDSFDAQQKNGRQVYNNYLEVNQEVTSLKQQNQRLRDELNHLINMRVILESKINVFEQEIKRLQEKVKTLNEENNNTSQRTLTLISQNQTISRNQNIVQSDLDYERKDKDQLKKKNLELQELLLQYQKQITLFQQELDRLQKIIKGKDEKILQSDTLLKVKNENIDKLNQSILQISQIKNEQDDQILRLRHEIERIKERSNIFKYQNQRLKKEIENKQKQLQSIKATLQKEIVMLQEDNLALIEELAKIQDYESDKEDLNLNIKRLQDEKKMSDKKKKKDDLNNSYNLMRLVYLEQQSKRLKQEKRVIQAKDLPELKKHVAILIEENYKLKKIITEYEQKMSFKQMEIQYLKEGYEKEINELKQKVSDQSTKTINKAIVKNMIRNVNSDSNQRNKFYEDEIKRIRHDKNEGVKRIQTDYNYLKDDYEKQKQNNNKLQGEKTTLEQNRRNLETVMRQWELKFRQVDAQKSGLKIQSQSLKYEIKKLKQEKIERQRKIAELRRLQEEKTKDYSFRISKYIHEINELKSKLQTLENINQRLKYSNQRNLQLEEEIASLRRKLQDKTTDLVQKQKLIRNLRSQNEGFINQIKMLERQFQEQTERYQQKILGIENCISKLTSENSSLRKEKIQMNREYGKKKNQLDDNIQKLKRENENLSEKIKDLSKKASSNEEQLARLKRETDQLKKKSFDIEFSHSNKVQSYEKNIDVLHQENQILKKKQNTINDSSKRIEELERLLSLANSEIDRTKRSYSSQDIENNRLKRDYQKLKSDYNNLVGLKQKDINEIILQKEQKQKLIRQNKRLEEQANRFDRMVKQMSVQFDRLHSQISKFRMDRVTNIGKNQQLTKEVKRLMAVNKELEEKIKQMGISISDQIALEKRIKEHLSLFIVLFAQIESLRKQVQEKDAEINALKKKNLSLL